jgi:CheY-like chemotaxis protein
MAEREPARLLVVDDDPDVGRLLELVASSEGYPVARAASGREAIERADDADLVLLDYHLPDMTGLDALEAIRRRGAAPGVVIVTAHGNEGIAAAALRAGADDYLVKDASLAERLPQVLERARRTRALRAALAGAERELVRAERLAAIGEMMTTLHHEINNPLMAALAELDLIDVDGEALSETHRAGLAGVRHSLERIRDLLRRASSLRRAQTTEYLQGRRMIDLAAGAAGAAGATAGAQAPQRGTAVLHVPEEDLARITSLLLRHTGFHVHRVETVDDLRRWSDAVGVRLVVVAGESPVAGGDPLGGFRPAAERDYTVVALVGGDGAAAVAAGADHVIHLPFDPATFGAELLGAMETR